MKHELKLLLFFILLSLNCFAESSGIQKINSETELIDGNIYTLRGFNPVTNMCYTFDGWHVIDDDSLYQFKRVENLSVTENKSIGYSNLWKLCKIGDQWGLMNLNFGSRFLSSSPNNYNSSYTYLKKTFDSSCYVKFVGSGDDMKINVGGKNLVYYNNIDYTFYPSILKKCVDVQICRMDSPIILVDEKRDLDKISPVVVSIKLARTLKDDEVNTFIVPFDIPNYKNVFGANAHVYLPTDYADYKIIFTELSDNDIIKANTPYLLKGTFDSSAYVVNNVMLDFNGEGECMYNVGELTIHGLYKSENIGMKDSYIFQGDQICKCCNTPHVYISPYRWYFTSEKEQLDNTLMKLIYDEGEATMINTPFADRHIKNEIYRLDGVKMNCADSRQLQHGIYIINGRKIMK